MTSTNDGKDVKSNPTSSPKGKAYFIELYKIATASDLSEDQVSLIESLDARLSGGGERARPLCEAWRCVHALCLHATPTTRDHLAAWLQRHTANIVLQTSWQKPEREDDRTSLEAAIDCLRAVSGAPWELDLVARGAAFKRILRKPWDHPVLTALINPSGEPPGDDEVLQWLKEERGVTLVARLQTLVREKCDDIAVSLATAVMERVRASRPPVQDTEQPEQVPESAQSFARRLSDEAGFTADVWDSLADIELVLLHKRDSKRCIALAKQIPLLSAYPQIERLQKRLELAPQEKRLWKNTKEVAILIAQVVIARCMVLRACAGAGRRALYCCAGALARLLGERLARAADALAQQAPTAHHLHAMAAAVDKQSDEDMKPYVCELYVRALTAGMNELERLKLNKDKESDARAMEMTLAGWFVQLGKVLARSARFSCECNLTAFSLHPSRDMYSIIDSAPQLPPVVTDTSDKDEPATSEGSWANDSRSQTNLVKTSETLNLKQTQHQANVLSTAIFNEGEALGLNQTLCQDIAVLLSGPRVKTLSWDMDRALLLENCRAYMEMTHGGTRALTRELKYLNIDFNQYQHLPEEIDEDENDPYYGIEKGYEHLAIVHEPEPEVKPEMWASDDDKSWSGSSLEDYVPRRTNRHKTLQISSSEDEAHPLSAVAHDKRPPRSHSNERDPLHMDQDFKEHKERKKKDKSLKSSAPKIHLSKGKSKSKHRDLEATVTDSDYDSQGKNSLTSLTSEGGRDTPEDARPKAKSRPPHVQHEKCLLSKMQYRPLAVRPESPLIVRPATPYGDRPCSDEVRAQLSNKLLEHKRQKDELRQKEESIQAMQSGGGSTPRALAIHRPDINIPDPMISPKSVVIPDIPKSYISKEQLEQMYKARQAQRGRGCGPSASTHRTSSTPEPKKTYSSAGTLKMADIVNTSYGRLMAEIAERQSKSQEGKVPPRPAAAYTDGQRDFQNFLKNYDVRAIPPQIELPPSKKPMPVSRVVPVVPNAPKEPKHAPCAKPPQQKKPDSALNTFSRLSYLHKNKQNEMKNRTAQKPNSTYQDVSTELDEIVREQKEQRRSLQSLKTDSGSNPLLSSLLSAPGVSPASNVYTSQATAALPHSSHSQLTCSTANMSQAERDRLEFEALLRQQSKLRESLPYSTFNAKPSTSLLKTANAKVDQKQGQTLGGLPAGPSRADLESQILDVLANKVTKAGKHAVNKNLSVIKSSAIENDVNTTALEKVKVEKLPQPEWQTVMQNILKHKTPSRGPNALDVALKKSSFELAFEKSLQRPGCGTSKVVETKSATVRSVDRPKPQITSVQNVIYTDIGIKLEDTKIEHAQLSEKPKVAQRKTNEKPKTQIDTVQKNSQENQSKQFIFTGPKQDDPFISGIHKSDYDLLEELMDEDLRKEIGELSSDEDSFNTMGQSCVKATKAENKPVITEYNNAVNVTNNIVTCRLNRATNEASPSVIVKQATHIANRTPQVTQRNETKPLSIGALTTQASSFPRPSTPVIQNQAHNMNLTQHRLMMDTGNYRKPSHQSVKIPAADPEGVSKYIVPASVADTSSKYTPNAPTKTLYQGVQHTESLVLATSTSVPVISNSAESALARTGNDVSLIIDKIRNLPATSIAKVRTDTLPNDRNVTKTETKDSNESHHHQQSGHDVQDEVKSCERKVLSEVQDVVVSEKNDSTRNQVVDDIVKDVHFEKERLKNKRLAILNRKIYHRCGEKVIPLPYYPLPKTESVEENSISKVQIVSKILDPKNDVQKVSEKLSDTEEENLLAQIKNNLNYLSDAINDVSSPATPDSTDSKENKDETAPCHKTPLRSSSKLTAKSNNTEISEIVSKKSKVKTKDGSETADTVLERTKPLQTSEKSDSVTKRVLNRIRSAVKQSPKARKIIPKPKIKENNKPVGSIQWRSMKRLHKESDLKTENLVKNEMNYIKDVSEHQIHDSTTNKTTCMPKATICSQESVLPNNIKGIPKDNADFIYQTPAQKTDYENKNTFDTLTRPVDKIKGVLNSEDSCKYVDNAIEEGTGNHNSSLNEIVIEQVCRTHGSEQSIENSTDIKSCSPKSDVSKPELISRSEAKILSIQDNSNDNKKDMSKINQVSKEKDEIELDMSVTCDEVVPKVSPIVGNILVAKNRSITSSTSGVHSRHQNIEKKCLKETDNEVVIIDDNATDRNAEKPQEYSNKGSVAGYRIGDKLKPFIQSISSPPAPKKLPENSLKTYPEQDRNIGSKSDEVSHLDTNAKLKAPVCHESSDNLIKQGFHSKQQNTNLNKNIKNGLDNPKSSIVENAICKNMMKNTNKKDVKTAHTRHQFPQDFIDKIKIEKMPSNDPHEKKVRVILPNGKKFKCTVHGKPDVSFDVLFALPSIRDILIKGLDSSKFLATLDLAKPDSLVTEVISHNTPVHNVRQKPLETIDLLSDDEDDVKSEINCSKPEVFVIETEYGNFPVSSIDKDLYIKHQKRLKQKTKIVLQEVDKKQISLPRQNDYMSMNLKSDSIVSSALSKIIATDKCSQKIDELKQMVKAPSKTAAQTPSEYITGLMTDIKNNLDPVIKSTPKGSPEIVDIIDLSDDSPDLNKSNSVVEPNKETLDLLKNDLITEIQTQHASNLTMPISSKDVMNGNKRIDDSEAIKKVPNPPMTRKRRKIQKLSDILTGQSCPFSDLDEEEQLKITRRKCAVKLTRCDELALLHEQEIIDVERASNDISSGDEPIVITEDFPVLNDLDDMEEVEDRSSSPIIELNGILISMDIEPPILNERIPARPLTCGSVWFSTKSELRTEATLLSRSYQEYKRMTDSTVMWLHCDADWLRTKSSECVHSRNINETVTVTNVTKNNEDYNLETETTNCEANWLTGKYELHRQNMALITTTQYDLLTCDQEMSNRHENVLPLSCDASWLTGKPYLHMQKVDSYVHLQPATYEDDEIDDDDVQENSTLLTCTASYLVTKSALHIQEAHNSASILAKVFDSHKDICDKTTTTAPLACQAQWLHTKLDLHSVATEITDLTRSFMRDDSMMCHDICSANWHLSKSCLSMFEIDTSKSVHRLVQQTIPVSCSALWLMTKSALRLHICSITTSISSQSEKKKEVKCQETIPLHCQAEWFHDKTAVCLENKYDASRVPAIDTSFQRDRSMSLSSITLKRLQDAKLINQYILIQKSKTTSSVTSCKRKSLSQPLAVCKAAKLNDATYKSKLVNVSRISPSVPKTNIHNDLSSRSAIEETEPVPEYNNINNVNEGTLHVKPSQDKTSSSLTAEEKSPQGNSSNVIAETICIESQAPSPPIEITATRASKHSLSSTLKSLEHDNLDDARNFISVGSSEIVNTAITIPEIKSTCRTKEYIDPTDSLEANLAKILGEPLPSDFEQSDQKRSVQKPSKTCSNKENMEIKNDFGFYFSKSEEQLTMEDHVIVYVPTENVIFSSEDESEKDHASGMNNQIDHNLKHKRKSTQVDDAPENICCTENIINANSFKVKKPKRTYIRSEPAIVCRSNLKRKIEMSDVKTNKKKYRKGRNIDYPKFTVTSLTQTLYGKEYKTLIDYCSSVKFSFDMPFHKEHIDVQKNLESWPIQNIHNESNINTQEPSNAKLFVEIDESEALEDPLKQSLHEEISSDFDENRYTPSNIHETNFNMGFGERSGRVIQGTIDGEYLTFSAATLSDVKQLQPLLPSDEEQTRLKLDEKLKTKQFIDRLNIREKVRAFFEKSSAELNSNWNQSQKKEDFDNDSSQYWPFGELTSTRCFRPSHAQVTVNVVQVGQLPVSAAAQNPVTCDPRVTQVSNASPSQCSPENSIGEELQTPIKTEYTELTTADITLPLMQEYTQHHTMLSGAPESSVNNGTSSTAEMKSVVKIELVEENSNDHEDDIASYENNGLQQLSNGNINSNMQYHFDGDTNNILGEPSSNAQSVVTKPPEAFSEDNPSDDSAEKSDQLAHAMNAAGIPATKSMPKSPSIDTITLNHTPNVTISQANANANFTKTTPISAIALQQALAQILPPSLNQQNSSDSCSPSANPQVLHIVQGNSGQSVINKSNGTQLLHIVQNKGAASNNGAPAAQQNTFSGLSLVDGTLQQGGNQLLHIVNTANQKNATAGQLLKRVNLLTNLANVQGSNEQKMVQFVCKSADGKPIQLPHQRSMVLRLQPLDPTVVPPTPKQNDGPDQATTSAANHTVGEKDANQQEMKSRSLYEENYAKFVQNDAKFAQNGDAKPGSEKATSLPKFNQVFGKQVYQDKPDELVAENIPQNPEQAEENAPTLEQMSDMTNPQLLIRKPNQGQSPQVQPNLVQQIKQTIGPMNIQTMHGGVIYTRQIPVNIGNGQTINLITVPSTELVDDSVQKQTEAKFGSQEGDPPIIKLVPTNQAGSAAGSADDSSQLKAGGDGGGQANPQPTPQPVLTQMRIKLPMLSKAPQMVAGTRLVRPSFFQIQRNVIGGANQQVYQQLVLTAAPPITQSIRLPTQLQKPKMPSESQSSPESQMSSSTLEQLREFDMVLEQVKERSTVQPGASTSNTNFKAKASTETAEAPPSTPQESPTQVLYSVGNTLNMVNYVTRKSTITTTTTSSFVRSPDSTGTVESPTSSSSHVPHTATSDSCASSCASEAAAAVPSHHKPKKKKPKPSTANSNPFNIKNTPKPSSQKPLEDEQTTQRILYILAEYKEQVENSPDKDKPAPRRRNNPAAPNAGSSKRKKSSSGSRKRDMSPVLGEDSCRTMGSEDSSCGTSLGECADCSDAHSPSDSPKKVARRLTFEQEQAKTPAPAAAPPRNVIVTDGQAFAVRGPAGKPATTVLMPANYLLPVSMVKGGQQIAIVTNRGPKLLVGGEGAAGGTLLFQRLIGPGLKPVLARPGVRHIRLPAAALHNLQAFNVAPAADSTASPAPAPEPAEGPAASPWPERDDLKPDRGSSPEGSEPWNLPSSSIADDYGYEEIVRTDNMDRTVLDAIPDRYSPDLEAQRIFDKMFDTDKKSMYESRCGFDVEASDEDKTYQQVVHRKDGRQTTRLTHVSAAALRHKYAILEHELRLQKSLSEECSDLGVDSPSASELFPEAELLFAPSPHDASLDHCHTPQPSSHLLQSDLDSQLPSEPHKHALELSLDDVGEMVTVGDDGVTAIPLDHEEFARSHPNTTFHSEPEDAEVPPFTITQGAKGRPISFPSRAAGTVVMPPQSVISQADVKFSDIDNIIDSLPSQHSLNLPSVLVKDGSETLAKFDRLLNESRDVLANPAIVHSTGSGAQVIRRVYDRRDSRYLDEEAMLGEPSPDEPHLATSSPDRHPELFWTRKRFDFSSDSDKCRSPFDESNSDSSGVVQARLQSVIKAARPERRTDTEDTHPPLRTYPAKRSHHSDGDRGAVGKSHYDNDRNMMGKSHCDTDRSVTSKSHCDGDRNSMKKSHYEHDRSSVSKSHCDNEKSSGRSHSDGDRGSGRSRDRCHDERRRASGRGVVKRGCHCCNGSTAPKPKKSRPKRSDHPHN